MNISALKWYEMRQDKYVTFDLDIFPYTVTLEENGTFAPGPHESGQIIAQTYCIGSGRFQLFHTLKMFMNLYPHDAHTTFFIALLLCEKLVSSKLQGLEV